MRRKKKNRCCWHPRPTTPLERSLMGVGGEKTKGSRFGQGEGKGSVSDKGGGTGNRIRKHRGLKPESIAQDRCAKKPTSVRGQGDGTGIAPKRELKT